MSYSIIFQTKVLDCGDGSVILFSRQGCNNDTVGRKKDVFSAKIYGKSELEKMAKSYMECDKPYKDGGDFALKIGSRPGSMYDYGKHILRALKHCDTIDSFKDKYIFSAKHFKGIEVTYPFSKRYDNGDILYDIWYRKGDFEGVTEPVHYFHIIDMYNDILDCIDLISDNNIKFDEIEFYIKNR